MGLASERSSTPPPCLMGLLHHALHCGGAAGWSLGLFIVSFSVCSCSFGLSVGGGERTSSPEIDITTFHSEAKVSEAD